MIKKTRLGKDFCEYCNKEFKSGCEKDRKQKDTHLRNTHTSEYNVSEEIRSTSVF